MKGPDFIIAGFAKAGTTALWHWLDAHPDIFLPAVKEPGFFSHEGRAARPAAGTYDPVYAAGIVTDWDAYLRLFDGAGDRVRGEASPIYALDPEAPARIAARCPDARVILLVRSPVARAFSQFAHHVRDGLEPIGDFGAALEAEARRLAEGWSPFFAYAGGGVCRPVIERFEAAIAPGRLLVLFHEDMDRAPETTYRAVCAFLGIEPVVLSDLAARRNTASATATGARSAWLRRLLAHPPAPLRALVRLLPMPLRRRLKGGIAAVNATAGPGLDAGLARRLAARFSDDIDWLERRFGRDLSTWRG